MKATGPRDSAAELAVRHFLHKRGMRYRVHARPIPDTRRRADIVFSRDKVAVYVDGCFWHGCPKHGTWPKANAEWWRNKIETNQRRDADTDAALREKGWTVLRFWEHVDPEAAAAQVVAAVRDRRPSTGRRAL